jgi:hypothetical protein
MPTESCADTMFCNYFVCILATLRYSYRQLTGAVFCSPQMQVGSEKVAYKHSGYREFCRAHSTGADFVSIEEKYHLSFSNPEIVIHLETITREAEAVF